MKPMKSTDIISNELTKNEANELRKSAQSLAKQSAEVQWKQAEALMRIRYSGYATSDVEVAPLWQLWNYEDWFDYVEQECGMHVGKANGLVEVAKFFHIKMGKAWNGRILSMNRMKALSRSQVVTQANLNNWISKAATMGPCDLEHELGENHSQTKTKSLRMTPTQKTAFDSRVAELAEEYGTTNVTDTLFALMGIAKKKGRKAA